MRYSTSIAAEGLFFVEQRKVLDFINKGLTKKEIKEKIVTEDIFSYKSLARQKYIYRTTVKRTDILTPFLIEEFQNASIDEKKIIILYAIIKRYNLLFEFMIEVVREKFLKNELILKKNDLDMFFREKAIQSEQIDNWKPGVINKLKRKYIQILNEANILYSLKNKEIQKPILSRDITDHLKSIGDKIYLKALLGEE